MNNLYRVIIIFGILSQINFCASNSTSKSREHKIHNIVLYPDKHSWCTATAIVQVVGHSGCNSVKLDNHVCVGACFSYIVPKTIPETQGDVLPYCDSCQPERISWQKVTLECTEGDYKNQNLTKYVQLIHDCNCGSCSEHMQQQQVVEQTTEEVAEFELFEKSATFDQASDFNPLNDSSSKDDRFKTVISRLFNTLKNENESIFEGDEAKGLPKNVWKKLLDKVQAMNSSININSLTQLIKSVEEESNVKFDYKRLKQALLKFKKYQVVTRAHTKEEEKINSQHSPVLPSTEANYQFGPGPSTRSQLPKLPPTRNEENTGSPLVDLTAGYLKPTTSKSEIAYNDHIEANNSHKIIKKEKSDLLPVTNTTDFSTTPNSTTAV